MRLSPLPQASQPSQLPRGPSRLGTVCPLVDTFDAGRRWRLRSDGAQDDARESSRRRLDEEEGNAHSSTRSMPAADGDIESMVKTVADGQRRGDGGAAPDDDDQEGKVSFTPKRVLQNCFS